MAETADEYTILIGNPEGRRPSGTPVRRVGVILKLFLKEWDVIAWIGFR
jgi:hypothetical protein